MRLSPDDPPEVNTITRQLDNSRDHQRRCTDAVFIVGERQVRVIAVYASTSSDSFSSPSHFLQDTSLSLSGLHQNLIPLASTYDPAVERQPTEALGRRRACGDQTSCPRPKALLPASIHHPICLCLLALDVPGQGPGSHKFGLHTLALPGMADTVSSCIRLFAADAALAHPHDALARWDLVKERLTSFLRTLSSSMRGFDSRFGRALDDRTEHNGVSMRA